MKKTIKLNIVGVDVEFNIEVSGTYIIVEYGTNGVEMLYGHVRDGKYEFTWSSSCVYFFDKQLEEAVIKAIEEK